MEIDLTSCGFVSDHSLAKLMESCLRLHPDKVLSDKKGPAFLAAIASKHSDLEQIDLSGCRHVTEESLASLIAGCPKLHPDKIIFPAVNAIKYGIRCNVPEDECTKGWTKHYDELYSHKTRPSHIDPGKGEYILVAAKRKDSDTIAVCAMAKRTDVFRKTSSTTECHLSNGAYWYNNASRSFGFANSNKIYLNSGDTTDLSSAERLSWKLNGYDGYRAGGMRDSNCTSTYRKLLYYGDGVLVKGKGDIFLSAVAEHHQHITEIDLLGCEMVSDTGLAMLMEKCPKLHPDKVMSKNKGPLFVAAVATYQSDITEIDLIGCDSVNDDGLGVLITKCAKLHPDKVLSYVKGPVFVAAVAKHRPDLTQIELNCAETEAELVALLLSCPQLHPDAIASGCKAKAFYAAVAKHRPELVSVDIGREKDSATPQGWDVFVDGKGVLDPTKMYASRTQSAYPCGFLGYPIAAASGVHKLEFEVKTIGSSKKYAMVGICAAGFALETDPKFAAENTSLFCMFLDQEADKTSSYGYYGNNSATKGCALSFWDQANDKITLLKQFESSTKYKAGSFVRFEVGRKHKAQTSLKIFIDNKEIYKVDSLKALGLPQDTVLHPYGYFEQMSQAIGLRHKCNRWKGVGDDVLASLIQSCPQLLPDNIKNAPSKGKLFCEAVTEHHSELTQIDLRGCNASDEDLAVLLKGCPYLAPSKILSPSKGSKFFVAMAEERPELTVIDLAELDESLDGRPNDQARTN